MVENNYLMRYIKVGQSFFERGVYVEYKYVLIGNHILPIIIDKGVRYYPISYITTKILLRSGKNALINKNNRKKYKQHIKKFSVKFNEGNIQEANCISEEALKEVLQNTKQGALSIEQRKSQNKLHEFLGIEKLNERDIIIQDLSKEYLDEHDEYTQDVIMKIIKNEKMLYKLCSKCVKYYPLHNVFFSPDDRTRLGYSSVCVVCMGKSDIFKHPDKEKYNLRKQEIKYYKAMKEDNLLVIYEGYLEGKLKHLPDCYQNKKSYLKIIEYLYNKNKLNKSNLTSKVLINEFKLNRLTKIVSMHEIYTYLFGEDYYFYPWKYPKFSYKEIKLTFEIANKVLKNYLNEKGIEINDPLSFDYETYCREARIRKLTNNDVLYFAVQFNEFKYPGYKYKISSKNYYKNDDNVLFDLKYLIEKDLRIQIEKIPLYLTKSVLQKKCKPLYYHIITKNNGSIFEWVNKLYPNKFIEADFEINPYRNEFDSDTESFIHELLKSKFNNVLYNQKHNERTITINGMIPDWFVFTDNGVWIIEYFGMFTPDRCYNTRIKDYIDKTYEKIEKYKRLKGYKYIFLFPEDVEDDFKGTRKKLEEIEKSIELSRD